MKEPRIIDDTHLWELKRIWEERRHALGIQEPPTDLAAINLEVRHQQLQAKGGDIPRGIYRYATFSSPNPRFPFTFLYPDTWQIKEIEEQAYGEVFIIGPRNLTDTFNAGITVVVVPTREVGGKFATVEEVLIDFLTKSRRLAGWQELSQTRGYFLSSPAVEVTVFYALRLPLNSSLAQPTPTIERKIIIKHGSCFYKLTYQAVEEDYPLYLDAFQTVMRTFEFLDERRDAHIFYPLVTQAPAYAVGEEQAGYEPT